MGSNFHRMIVTSAMLLISVFLLSCRTASVNSNVEKNQPANTGFNLTGGEDPAAGLCPEGFIDTCTMKAAPNLKNCGCVPKEISCESDRNCPSPMKCGRWCNQQAGECSDCAKKTYIHYYSQGRDDVLGIENVKFISQSESICVGKTFAIEFEAVNNSGSVYHPPQFGGIAYYYPTTRVSSSLGCWKITINSATPSPHETLPFSVDTCSSNDPTTKSVGWMQSWSIGQRRSFRVDLTMENCPSSTSNLPSIHIDGIGWHLGSFGAPVRFASINLKCTASTPNVCCENVVNGECQGECTRCNPKSDFKNCTGDEYLELWNYGGSCTDKTSETCEQ